MQINKFLRWRLLIPISILKANIFLFLWVSKAPTHFGLRKCYGMLLLRNSPYSRFSLFVHYCFIRLRMLPSGSLNQPTFMLPSTWMSTSNFVFGISVIKSYSLVLKPLQHSFYVLPNSPGQSRGLVCPGVL